MKDVVLLECGEMWEVCDSELHLPLGSVLMVVDVAHGPARLTLRGVSPAAPCLLLTLDMDVAVREQGMAAAAALCPEDWQALDWFEVQAERQADGEWVLDAETGLLGALVGGDVVVLCAQTSLPGREVWVADGRGLAALLEALPGPFSPERDAP